MSAAPGDRVRVVDLLRLVATFQMVQGHTLDAVLDVDARSGPWFGAWSWTRGLTSVAFLFVTGLSFHLATVVKLERHLGDPDAVTRRLRRGALLIAIGYALHVPLFPGGDLGGALRGAVIVDVLQNIGVSLWLLEGTVLALRSARQAAVVWGLAAAALLAGAPLAAQLSAEGPLRPLLNYVTPAGGSIFPLLPWAGHALAGAALAPFLLSSDRRQRNLRFALVGLGLMVVAWAVRAAGWGLLAMHLARLGAVCGAGALLVTVERASERLPPWVFRLSRETLFVYVVHIVLAYGSGPSLRTLVGSTLPIAPALGVAASMMLLCAGAALVYPRLLRGLARGAEAG